MTGASCARSRARRSCRGSMRSRWSTLRPRRSSGPPVRSAAPRASTRATRAAATRSSRSRAAPTAARCGAAACSMCRRGGVTAHTPALLALARHAAGFPAHLGPAAEPLGAHWDLRPLWPSAEVAGGAAPSRRGRPVIPSHPPAPCHAQVRPPAGQLRRGGGGRRVRLAPQDLRDHGAARAREHVQRHHSATPRGPCGSYP